MLFADASALIKRYVVELSPDVTALARRCLMRHHLRSGDAIQLASALWLHQSLGEPLQGLLAFDARLVTAARDESIVMVGAT